MELSTLDEDVLIGLSKKLDNAYRLTLALEKSDDKCFTMQMMSNGYQFPSTHEKYSALGWKKLDKLKQSQKDELKSLLETETKSIVEEAGLNIHKPKFIFGEQLPADLSESHSKLDEMKELKKQKIKELSQEIDGIEYARYALNMMQRDQDKIQTLETNAKKQKI